MLEFYVPDGTIIFLSSFRTRLHRVRNLRFRNAGNSRFLTSFEMTVVFLWRRTINKRKVSHTDCEQSSPHQSLSHPSRPSLVIVAIFFSKISPASGNAATARETLASRNRCSVGYGERLV